MIFQESRLEDGSETAKRGKYAVMFPIIVFVSVIFVTGVSTGYWLHTVISRRNVDAV